MKSGSMLAAVLALGGCGQPEASKPPAPPPAKAAVDPKSAEGAADVVARFATLLQSRRYKEAHRLWSGDTASDSAFAATFSGYRFQGAALGKPGPLEGAAGSIYVEVPLQLFFTTGRDIGSLSGTVTLRRVNDVPGSTDAQRRWHIVKTDLHPAD